MKSLTVRLPEALVTEIERESRSRRVSKSDVVRERLRRTEPAASESGGAGELLGDILQTSWQAKVGPKPRRFRSTNKRRLAEIIRARNLHR